VPEHYQNAPTTCSAVFLRSAASGPNITLGNVSGGIHLKLDANLGIEAEIKFLAWNLLIV
jgi:hypothetical protein